MKRKWRILGAVLAVVLLCLGLYGLRLRIAPRWMLSRALGSALTELDTRFENSPARLILPVLDDEGHQKASLQLQTHLEHLGVVRYDMALQTQLTPCRVKAAGTVFTGGKTLDLELYLDQNFGAVSSQGLLGGHHYGLTYETFSQDIRSRELLAVLIGEKTISAWEESVTGLQKTMSRDISLPEFSLEDVPTMVYGLLALKPQVGRTEILLSGQQMKADTVSFRATGQEIAVLAESYQDRLNSELQNLLDELKNTPNTAVSAVFYLHKDELVRIEVNLESPENAVTVLADLGQFPATNPLNLELEIREGEDLTRFTSSIDTKSDETHYAETLCFSQTQNGVLRNGKLGYDWDLSSGEMALSVLLNDRKADLRLNLAGEGESLILRTQDAAPLLNLFLKKPLTSPAICTLTLSPGSFVTAPEYRNLDQWSMEDLLTLLTGLGGLIGLKLP